MKKKPDITYLRNVSSEIRRLILDMTFRVRRAHLGGALSAVEIFVALYLGGVLNYTVENLCDKRRDRLILSKGHAALVLYATLNKAGFITNAELEKYHSNGHFLSVHPQINIEKGIEYSGGSLGQGLSHASGIALALKLNGSLDTKVYVVLGDGECDEGSVWEAAAFAAHRRMNNLVVVVDKNKLQSDGLTEDILSMSPLAEKWRAFGWETLECDGHDFESLFKAFSFRTDKPKCIIADTIKGKGILHMENVKSSHHPELSQKQYEQAVRELEGLQ